MMRGLARFTAIALISSAAYAQMAGMDHEQMAAPKANEPASTRAYRVDMGKMHEHMDITYTGDADRDFVNGMIPHHEGAIDMAKTELKYGKDERLRQMAKGIIAAQTKEVNFMHDWQNNNLPSAYKQTPAVTTKQ